MVFEIVESFYLNIYTTLNWIKNSKQTTEKVSAVTPRTPSEFTQQVGEYQPRRRNKSAEWKAEDFCDPQPL